MSSGGRPVLELDLEVTATYQAIMDTFAYAPGQRNQQASREPGRYGGQQVVGETNDNGTVSWQALVQGGPGQSIAVVAANVEALLLACERTGRDRLLEWRPEGAAFSSYFRVAGPAAWKPTYQWRVWQGSQAMVVEVSFPVRPLVLWDPMTIVDDFSVDSTADYTFDGATAADVAVSGGALTPVVGAATTTERRARHTVRGYPLLEGQATAKFTPNVTATGFKGGVLLRGSAPTTYVECYVDDNGTNSRLRVDVVIAGTVTNRASVNLAARISTGAAFWVRGRIVGGVVFAEHFTAAPTPTGTPTTASPSGGAGYTLVSGDAPLNTTAGFMGWSWIARSTSATMDDFEARPFVRAGVTPPAVMHYADQIPGSAPALADTSIAQASADVRYFAMIAWAQQSASSVNVPGILDSGAATHTGLTETSSATAYGGTDARTTSVAAGLQIVLETAKLQWSLSAVDWTPDDFSESVIDVEVWARLAISSTVVNPQARAALSSNNAIRTFTIEYGSAGRSLPVPSGSPGYMFARLGVIPVDAEFSSGFLQIAVGCSSGSSGTLGIDYAMLIPARRRAASPSNVSGTDSYPTFLPGLANSQRTIRSDLSGLFSIPPAGASRYHGLGGSLIQVPPGLADVLVDVRSTVPADTDGGTNDALGDPVTTMLDVVPRSNLLRSA